MWRVSNEERVKTLIGQSNSVKRLVFSLNGEYLASGSWNCIIDVWRVSSGKHIKRLTEDFDPIKSLVFSPNGECMDAYYRYMEGIERTMHQNL